MTLRFSCPQDTFAAELEFAIAYLVACNPARTRGLLVPAPHGRRAEFAGQIAAMLAERAEKGLSGMKMEDTRPAEVPEETHKA